MPQSGQAGGGMPRPRSWRVAWFLLAGAVLLILSGISIPRSTFQLAAVTDVAILRMKDSAGLQLTGLRVTELTVAGADMLQLPDREPSRVPAGAVLTILGPGRAPAAQPPDATPPQAARMELRTGAGAAVRVMRVVDEPLENRYAIDAEGAGGQLLIILQPGQTLQQGGMAVYSETGSGSQIRFVGGRSGLQVHMTAMASHPGRVVPTSLAALSFLGAFGNRGDAAAWPSGLASAELAFLEVPDKRFTLGQNAMLHLEDVNAVLQSFSLRDGHIALNAAGELGSARLQIGPTKSRSLEPTWFEYLANSFTARVLTGLLGALGSVMGFIELLRKKNNVTEDTHACGLPDALPRAAAPVPPIPGPIEGSAGPGGDAEGQARGPV